MSPLGFDYDANVINLGDSAEVYAHIWTERDVPVPEDDLAGVEFTIQYPDEVTKETLSGEITKDGTGYVRFETTDTVGEYKAVATFNFADSSFRSVRCDFEVIDPFDPPAPDELYLIGDLVWDRFEDLFDSEEGGPWLQDMTKNTFKKEKMEMFVAEGLFDINQANPPTDLTLEGFFVNGQANADSPLLVQGVLLAVIRHLMRSYVEQPLPTGAQIAYMDRRDYLMRWQSILQAEEDRYMRFLALWKRQFLGLGSSRVLVGSKAGRLIPAPMRTRNVGRGWY